MRATRYLFCNQHNTIDDQITTVRELVVVPEWALACSQLLLLQPLASPHTAHHRELPLSELQILFIALHVRSRRQPESPTRAHLC